MYNKTSEEYISNGHYRINGEDFMSVWTFKKKYGIFPNTNQSNGEDGQTLMSEDVTFYPTKPDFGGFNTIYVYPVTELKKFYNVA
jgi:hypothetical protein